MPTYPQLTLKKHRKKKIHKNCKKHLQKCPQKIGTCIKVTTRKPKKPNSAQRKIAKIQINKTKKKLWIYLPGIGHSLQPFSTVLIRGGRVQDMPGIKYKAIRGKLDFNIEPVLRRSHKRSKYGLKRILP